MMKDDTGKCVKEEGRGHDNQSGEGWTSLVCYTICDGRRKRGVNVRALGV